MNQHTTNHSPEDELKVLSFSEKRELLSPQGIAVSRVAEILGSRTITISTSLRKIGMKNHFSEPAPLGTTRIIVLVSAWVRALLKQIKPIVPKKTKVSPIKPHKLGMFFVDFETMLGEINPSRSPNATTVWHHLTQNHPLLFQVAIPDGSNRSAYQLKEEEKEAAIRWAKKYIQRANENTSQWRRKRADTR